MPINPFFNNFTSVSEQNLVEDLVVESIKQYGHDVHYIPRVGVNIDDILNEYEYSDFKSNYIVEVYIKNFDAFGGEGNFLSKFGLEVRDQMVLQISIRSFNRYVASRTELTRPREGDLIFIPMINAVYEIKYVENAAVFFQMGSMQSWELTCELFEYSNETFDTGNTDIDALYNVLSIEDDIDNDKFNQNEEIQQEANTWIDWSDKDPFSENGEGL